MAPRVREELSELRLDERLRSLGSGLRTVVTWGYLYRNFTPPLVEAGHRAS
jgi:hypothetical protein